MILGETRNIFCLHTFRSNYPIRHTKFSRAGLRLASPCVELSAVSLGAFAVALCFVLLLLPSRHPSVPLVYSRLLYYPQIYLKMKTFVAVLLAALVACTTAFAPVSQQAQSLAPLAMAPQEEAPLAEAAADSNAAALAAFATAMAPFAAQAADIDEGTVIGYGAGLVACVVSLAVGFSIGYGTLVKP